MTILYSIVALVATRHPRRRLLNTEGLNLTVGDVVPTSEAFTARLETVEAGRRYRVAITPRDTAKAVSAAFRIHAATAAGKAVIFSAYGNVR